MLDRIFVHSWMALPVSTRARLRELLGIPKTGQTDVSTDGSGTSTLISDGVTAKDLEVVTVKLLQEVTGSSEIEFPRLWSLAVNKVDMVTSEISIDSIVKSAEKEVEALAEKIAVEIITDLGTGDNGSVAVENEKSISKESN